MLNSEPHHCERMTGDSEVIGRSGWCPVCRPIRSGSNEAPKLDVSGQVEEVTLPELSSAYENRRTCEACRGECAGYSLLRTAPPDAHPPPDARGISHLQRARP